MVHSLPGVLRSKRVDICPGPWLPKAQAWQQSSSFDCLPLVVPPGWLYNLCNSAELRQAVSLADTTCRIDLIQARFVDTKKFVKRANIIIWYACIHACWEHFCHSDRYFKNEFPTSNNTLVQSSEHSGMHCFGLLPACPVVARTLVAWTRKRSSKEVKDNSGRCGTSVLRRSTFKQ